MGGRAQKIPPSPFCVRAEVLTYWPGHEEQLTLTRPSGCLPHRLHTAQRAGHPVRHLVHTLFWDGGIGWGTERTLASAACQMHRNTVLLPSRVSDYNKSMRPCTQSPKSMVCPSHVLSKHQLSRSWLRVTGSHQGVGLMLPPDFTERETEAQG